MNQTTKKQHYIWRNYLSPWTNDNSTTGKILCLRDNKIFPVSLNNIAHENYFYGVAELSQLEKAVIYEMVIKNTKGAQRTANEGWLKLYCEPFDFVDRLTSFGYSMWGHTSHKEIRKEQEFKDWNIGYIERLHSLIESQGEPFISALRIDDVSFWENEDDRDKFSFFLSNQFFRTKKSRDAILKALNKGKAGSDLLADICPERMWIS